MVILQINKFYYLSGGVERCVFNLEKILKRKGHEVVTFSMEHPKNRTNPHSGYFVRNVNLNGNRNTLSKIKSGIKSVYSIEAQKQLTRLINDTKPDIAHIHSYCYQLTPSILLTLKKEKIPAVQTSHEYKLICPNQRLFNLYTGEICENCKNRKYYKAIINKCIKNSIIASMAGCMEAYLSDKIQKYEKIINKIISPSSFLRNKLIEFGINPKKVVHIPNFIFKDEYLPKHEFSNYIVYVGRLSGLKGIKTLINAMKLVDTCDLYIIGTGKLEDDLKSYIVKEKILNVKLIGKKYGEELKKIIRNSMFTVLPSVCYENCPNSILESFALGKPVIGSNIGGIPELIDDGYDGLLFGLGM